MTALAEHEGDVEPEAAHLIRSARFRAEREDDWQRLDALLRRVERRGIRSLSFAEAERLATLYGKTLTALSIAREISLDRNLLTYLEVLTARAFLAVYAPQQTLRGLLRRLLVYGIPGAVRRTGGAILFAALALFLGGLAGFLLFQDDPTWFNTFVPAGLGGSRGLGSTEAELLEVIYSGADAATDQLGAFASFLFSHNTRIAIFVFALGVVFCMPSFALTFYNGLIIGAFFGLHADRGVAYDLFGWLSIHGVTELGAIIIACAGGFHLGLGVIFPGRMRRADALRARGRDAVKLAVLAALMLLVAALLEAFLRQRIQDTELRLAIGWGIGLLWLAWFLLSGRRPA
ncbi:MAG: stage II sporulation protein M [Pseudomonadota bacterium]